MSEYLLPTEPEPPEQGEDGSRRHALIGLGALAGIAGVIVVTALAISALSGGGGHHAKNGAGGFTAALESSGAPVGGPTTSARTSSTASPAATSQSVPPSTSAQPTAHTTGNPCPSVRPCAVIGDAGAAVAAVNQFRASHGAAPVPGTVSPQAGQCALQQGEGPACAPHYAWQAVPTQNGKQVVTMLTGRGGGMSWLLDPTMRSFSVGWAYVPNAAGGPGLYECAILKSTA